MSGPIELFQKPDQSVALGAAAASETNKAAQEIQAAMVIAKKFPRDEMAAIERIKNECCRQRLAEQALYQYAKGGSNISGPSIRLAEVLIRQWGNARSGFTVLSRSRGPDGIGLSEVMAYAWDLETNTQKATTFVVRHWRDKKHGGGTAIEDSRELYELEANNASRRVRACILSLIPGDIVDEAVDVCTATLTAKADTSPEGQQKLLTALGEFGVTKAQVEARIQRKMSSITPGLVVQLRKIYTSLKDGIAQVSDWFDPEKAEVPTASVPAPKREKAQRVTSSPQSEDQSATIAIASLIDRDRVDPEDAWKWADEKQLTPSQFLPRWDEFVLDYRGL